MSSAEVKYVVLNASDLYVICWSLSWGILPIPAVMKRAFELDHLSVFVTWYMCSPIQQPTLDIQYDIQYKADSRLVPSQWETSLQSNAVSHWLGPSLESSLHPANERRRYKVTPSLIGWAQASNHPCNISIWIAQGSCFVVVRYCLILPIPIKVALRRQLYDSYGVSKVTLKNMGK